MKYCILVSMRSILKFCRKVARVLLTLLLLLVCGYIVLTIVVRPSNNRNWNIDQAVPALSTISTTTISIQNIRNFTYRTTEDFTPSYYDLTLARGSVKKVWFVVEPFARPGFAHTFLSFEFDNGKFLSISVEIRKEIGESFDPLKGVLRQYEIMYVIADEHDVINLRTNYRNDNVFLYPAKISTAKANELFENMLVRANTLEEYPEFYNTLTNTCTTNIVDHINSVADKKVIPFDKRVLFPEDSDYYAYELGLIDTTLSKENLREEYRINELAKTYQDSPQFSQKIRSR